MGGQGQWEEYIHMCVCVCVCVCVCIVSWAGGLNFAFLHSICDVTATHCQGNSSYRNWEGVVEYDALQSDRILLAFLRRVVP